MRRAGGEAGTRSPWAAILAPARYQLRTHWGAALLVVLLAVLGASLLLASRSLAGTGGAGGPALALPAIPSPGPALMWTETARPPTATQAQSLAELLDLLSGLAWIGFGVAAISIFSLQAAHAGERAMETGIRRAVGAPLRRVFASLVLETLVLAVIALVIGVATGSALLAMAGVWWPGPVAGLRAADPAALLALAAVLGSAGLSSLRLVRSRHLVEASGEEIGLGIPTYQVAISVALLLGAAALLGDPGRPMLRDGSPPSAPELILRLDAGPGPAPERAQRYQALLGALSREPDVSQVSLTSGGAVLGLGTSGEVTTDCGLCYFGGILIKWPGFTALVHSVSTDTFRAQGLTVAEGRGFASGDVIGADRVAVVNRHLAQRYFRNGAAVGRSLFLAAGWPDTPYRVIGIVDDQRSPAIGGSIQPRETVYLSVLQHPPERTELLIRGAAASPPAVVAQRVLGERSAVVSLGPLSHYREPQRRATRWIGGGIGIAAGSVLFMGLVGTAATARRWADSIAWEVALRRAVGASRRMMTWYVLRRTASIGLAGGALGLFFYAVVLAPALAASLPALPLARPVTLAGVTAPVMLLALATAVVPALRRLGRPPGDILR